MKVTKAGNNKRREVTWANKCRGFWLCINCPAYDRIFKVARTIADLAESDVIRAEHISEADTVQEF